MFVKVSKAAIYDWLNKAEIYDVDIDNAFDLLSSLAGGTVEKDTLEFGIEAFRKYSANAASVLPELKGVCSSTYEISYQYIQSHLEYRYS